MLNNQVLTKTVILATLLLSLMCVHIIIVVPPIWTIPASVLVGLSYYLLRTSMALLRRDHNIEQIIIVAGFEAIVATATVYGLFIGLYVFWR